MSMRYLLSTSFINWVYQEHILTLKNYIAITFRNKHAAPNNRVKLNFI